MKKIAQILITFVIIFNIPTIAYGASSATLSFDEQSQDDQFIIGKVVEVFDESQVEDNGYVNNFQEVTLELLDSENKGDLISIDHGLGGELLENEKVKVGDKVSVLKMVQRDSDTDESISVYFISDFYRIPAMIWMFVFFIVLTVIFARKKGLYALIGLIFSLVVLLKFMIPQILAGGNPFIITFVGALFVMFISMFMAHGFHPRTVIAFISTLFTIFLALLMSVFFTNFVKVFGTGSQDAYSLQFLGNGSTLNLKGLFLGGIIIGTLGILDDITVSQAAIVDELKKANKSLTVRQLYTHAISVGREHIASLVNTLVLAYAGSSLPIFIMFAINKQNVLSLINSEFVAEEVVNTLIGSSALILAVPITTYLAAVYFSEHPSDPHEKAGHICMH